jgi:hypothetical protein
MAAAVAVAALVCLGLAYAIVKMNGSAGDIAALRADKSALEAQVAALKTTVDSLARQAKQQESVIGENGTLQALARGLASGEMDLSLRSLKIVSNGRALVTLATTPDQGGSVTVASAEASSSAVLASGAGRAQVTLRTDSGSDAAHVVELANFSSGGFALQRGATDKEEAMSAGARLRIAETGASLTVSGRGSGAVSLDAPSGDSPAALSVVAEADPARRVTVSAGTKDASASVSVTGSPAGFTLWLAPDRLTLNAKDGSVALGAAEDDNGGFVFVNDGSGARRAQMTAGTDGHGSVSVYGSDKKSNTLLPVYNIQQGGAVQK